MEFIGTLLLSILVALLLGTAITFGLTLILIIVCSAAVMALLIMAQEAWRRWKFVKSATDEQPHVIEGQYKDITHEEEKL